jgi:hypothetical protein
LWLEQTRQDVRHAFRTFARNPGFALMAVATLAAGIGVKATIFTAYDADCGDGCGYRLAAREWSQPARTSELTPSGTKSQAELVSEAV